MQLIVLRMLRKCAVLSRYVESPPNKSMSPLESSFVVDVVSDHSPVLDPWSNVLGTFLKDRFQSAWPVDAVLQSYVRVPLSITNTKRGRSPGPSLKQSSSEAS